MNTVVRPAVVADLLAVETVRVASWKVAYRGLLPDDLLDGHAVTEEGVARLRARMDGDGMQVVVASLADEVIGFAAFGPCRDKDLPEARELWALYVLPDHWRGGSGTALLRAAGPLDVVWVLEGNARGRAFYERHNFRPDGTVKVLNHIGGVTDMRYVLG